jgi:hypothetical protein
MDTTKLIKIATYYNQFDAELAKLKLEEKGIYCFMKNEYVAQLQFGIANFELMVNEAEKETALQIISESDGESEKE